ncbi:unnamed protein product, partial [Rotaria magnacalcarata]
TSPAKEAPECEKDDSVSAASPLADKTEEVFEGSKVSEASVDNKFVTKEPSSPINYNDRSHEDIKFKNTGTCNNLITVNDRDSEDDPTNLGEMEDRDAKVGQGILPQSEADKAVASIMEDKMEEQSDLTEENVDFDTKSELTEEKVEYLETGQIYKDSPDQGSYEHCQQEVEEAVKSINEEIVEKNTEDISQQESVFHAQSSLPNSPTSKKTFL